MLAGRAGWNGEEFVEGEHSWLAAFPALLTFVELGWAWVVDAWRFGGVCEGLAAALVDAFLWAGEGHVGLCSLQRGLRIGIDISFGAQRPLVA